MYPIHLHEWNHRRQVPVDSSDWPNRLQIRLYLLLLHARIVISAVHQFAHFLPISSEISELEGWARNPFVEVYEPKSANEKTTIAQDVEMDEQAGLLTLDGLVIETAVLMGEKAFVTINGQTFTVGDQINNALIEKIENEQITFKVGKTRIIKDVGT